MSGYNHVTLVGTLIEDPRTTKAGKRGQGIVSTMVIGCERFAGKDKPVEVDYFTIVAKGKLAEVVSEYLKKDKKILVDGRIQVTMHENKEGKRTWITEVIAENLKFLTVKNSIPQEVSHGK